MRLTNYQIQELTDSIPENLRDVMKKHGAMIAGGFVIDVLNDREPKDIDVYLPKGVDILKVIDEVESLAPYEASCRGESEYAFTIFDANTPIQLIKRQFDAPISLLREFDFTVCQVGLIYNVSGLALVHTEDWEYAYYNMELKYTHSLLCPALYSLSRVRRYTGKGYNISNGEFAKIITACYHQVRTYGHANGNVQKYIEDQLRGGLESK